MLKTRKLCVFVILLVGFTLIFTACEGLEGGLINFDALYKVGDTGPGGGIIFYVADGQNGRPVGFIDTFSGDRHFYLEAAPEDVTTFENRLQWAVSGHDFKIDNTLETIGSGRKNTALIVQQLGINAPAAFICDNYESDNGTDDWFMPSLLELQELFKHNRDNNDVNYSFTSSTYWSSSQSLTRDDSAYYSYTTITRISHGKAAAESVRPIRSFAN